MSSEEPPYPLDTAHLGGFPTPLPDTPVIIIFLLIFAFNLIFHLYTSYIVHHHKPEQDINLQQNSTNPTRPPRRRSHQHDALHRRDYFIPYLLTLFTLTRLAALATRLAWTYTTTTTTPTVSRTEIAATTLSNAASVPLLIANQILARRFLRAYAAFGVHAAVRRVSRVVVGLAVIALAIGVSVQADAYFTRDADARQEIRVLDLVASCLRVVIAVVPWVAVLVGGWVLPAEGEVRRDRRRFWARGVMICGVGLLLTVEEGFRTGVKFEGRGVGSQALFLSKACYYCFVVLVEALVVYVFLGARVDSRFRLRVRAEKGVGAHGDMTWDERMRDRINTDKEVFGNPG